MVTENTPVAQTEKIPDSITVQEYNKIWYKKLTHAESFILLLENAALTSGAYDSIMHQFKCIGWPEVQSTILTALEMYKEIMKSKCAGKSYKSEYRQVTLCEKCINCATISDDECICKIRGAMPLNGFCSSGIPKNREDINER